MAKSDIIWTLGALVWRVAVLEQKMLNKDSRINKVFSFKLDLAFNNVKPKDCFFVLD